MGLAREMGMMAIFSSNLTRVRYSEGGNGIGKIDGNDGDFFFIFYQGGIL